jgi:hypothetical protein
VYTLHSFSQRKQLLQGVTDPVLKKGVCVAACDVWLRLIKTNNEQPAAQRLQDLLSRRAEILAYQQNYGVLRGHVGPEDARSTVGQSGGLDFDHQTTIMHTHLRMPEVLSILSRDLQPLGGAAAWSMRFWGGGGHAIAGFHNVVTLIKDVQAQHQYNVFDPNLGEYVGDLSDLSAILSDLFGRFPLYGTTAEIRRAWEGRH